MRHEIIEGRPVGLRIKPVDLLPLAQQFRPLFRRHLAAIPHRREQRAHRLLPFGVGLGRLQISPIGVHLNDAPLGRQRLQPIIIDVARMVIDRLAPRMGQQHRRRGQGQQVVQHLVRTMRRIGHDTQPVHVLEQLLAQRTKPAITRLLRRVGRTVGKLVMREMGKAHHPHAHVVEGLEQADILTQRIGIFDRHIDDPLARRRDRRGVLRLQCQREIGRVRRHHLADRHAPHQREIARLGKPLDRQRPLPRIDGPETAIQPALLHARQIDLGIVAMHAMFLVDRPVRQVERRGRVEMAVERQQLLMQLLHLLGHGLRRHRDREQRDQRCPHHMSNPHQISPEMVNWKVRGDSGRKKPSPVTVEEI